jgi:hypothetical protein
LELLVTLKLPERIVVQEVVSSRYSPGQRPTSWDKRHSGLEVIKTESGQVLTLFSNGGQSSPHPGWELLLIEMVEDAPALASGKKSSSGSQQGGATLPAYSWTLYGLRPGSRSDMQAQA